MECLATERGSLKCKITQMKQMLTCFDRQRIIVTRMKNLKPKNLKDCRRKIKIKVVIKKTVKRDYKSLICNFLIWILILLNKLKLQSLLVLDFLILSLGNIVWHINSLESYSGNLNDSFLVVFYFNMPRFYLRVDIINHYSDTFFNKLQFGKSGLDYSCQIS